MVRMVMRSTVEVGSKGGKEIGSGSGNGLAMGGMSTILREL